MSSSGLLTKKIYVMLFHVGCDIPASRRVGGFVGHSAHLACNKCKKHFPGTVTTGFLYSGFNTDHWQARTDQATRAEMMEYNNFHGTSTAQKEIVKKNGTRYSVLIRLP